MCFYKAFRPVTAFLVVSFQAVLDISSYVVVYSLTLNRRISKRKEKKAGIFLVASDII